ncbi:MAG: phosphoribosylanthranilate isomerase [Piscirickettsiaceae bacterium]|nr:MAG: phosphoribosylanthranilate isomerase [Piscirickettsiaceae bacterium]PCI72187.1 MAG: phosphoribosylanthranilate isomerase [Piscirickettsiaceae bacterium]
MRTRVKICGITRSDDALVAINEGADALGFVFYKNSPRYITMTDAAVIFDKITPFINKVALFVNEEYAVVSEAISMLSINLLQFHGDEDEAYCASFNRPYIKAIRMQEGTDLKAISRQFSSASGLLIDAFDPAFYGGTGKTFDWNLLHGNNQQAIILAGGLTQYNVVEAINSARPYAVDVSSGVEKSKGVKDHLLIKQFMKEVKAADE